MYTCGHYGLSLPVLKSAQEADVRTRRQQLGLAAQAKENSKNGRGRGRGRGGKGRGKVGERPADATTIKPAVENKDGEASTPRRKLFEDEPDVAKPSKGSPMASGMDVDLPGFQPIILQWYVCADNVATALSDANTHVQIISPDRTRQKL